MTTEGTTDRNELYAELTRRVREAGLFEKRAAHYGVRLTFYVLVHVALLALVSRAGILASIALLTLDAVALLRIGFVAHDLAHGAVRSERAYRTLLAELVWSFFLGVSRDYWHCKHTLHHRFPNTVAAFDGDPDIVAPPLVLGPHQARPATPFGHWVVRRQHFLYWPVLCSIVFVLMIESVVYLVTGSFRGHRVTATTPRPLVALSIVAGIVLSNAPLFIGHTTIVAVVLVVYRYLIAGFVIGLTFALNHVGLPTVGDADTLDPLTLQTRTTRNIGGPFGRWFWGVLAFQIEHHLWPSLSWHVMPRAAAITRAFCEENDITYLEQTPAEALRDSYLALHALGTQYGVDRAVRTEGA